MPDQDLVSDIERYLSRKSDLVQEQQGLIGRLKGVLESDIIPQLKTHLPGGYTINVSTCEVDIHQENQDFYISLALEHEGQFCLSNEVLPIEKELYSVLHTIAEKYHLCSVDFIKIDELV